jgi:hypothetical protein
MRILERNLFMQPLAVCEAVYFAGLRELPFDYVMSNRTLTESGLCIR